jgi:hypothetical protein
LSSIFLTNPAWSQKAIILSGGGLNDQPRYENISKIGFETYSANKEIDIFIIGSDGKWPWINKNKIMPATTKKDILKKIKETLKSLKDGEVLDLFVTDHGISRTTRKGMPLVDTAIILKGINDEEFNEEKIITHQELADVIQNYKPKNSVVRTVGIHCYAGGLNHMASYTEGTCGSSSTNDKNLTYSSDAFNHYGFGFFEALKNHSKYSINEAHFKAMKNDLINNGRAQLSSQAFIENLIPEISLFENETQQIEIDFLNQSLKSKNEFTKRSIFTVIDKKISQVSHQKFMCEKPTQIDKINNSFTYLSQKMRDQITSVKPSLSEDQLKSNNQKAIDTIVKQLDSLKKGISEKNINGYKALLLSHEEDIKNMKMSRDEDYKKEKNPVRKEKIDLMYEIQTSNRYAKFRKEAHDIIPFEKVAEIRHLEMIQKVLLNSNVTEEQKAKLIDIIKCENKVM